MESIWWSNALLPEFPSLQENIHTDVLIIGGGIAGLLCAYRLQQMGHDIRHGSCQFADGYHQRKRIALHPSFFTIAKHPAPPTSSQRI